MPPGTGDVQSGLGRMLPRTDLIVVTTPALAAQKVAQRAADMAQRSFLKVVGVIENMSAFTDHLGVLHELFGSGGGAALADAIGAPLLGQVPIEAGVASGGDTGVPVSVSGSSAAAGVFRAVAARIVAEVAPPSAPDEIDMTGCSARLFDTVSAAFAELDADQPA